jgi:hypothetical protein
MRSADGICTVVICADRRLAMDANVSVIAGSRAAVVGLRGAAVIQCPVDVWSKSPLSAQHNNSIVASKDGVDEGSVGTEQRRAMTLC